MPTGDSLTVFALLLSLGITAGFAGYQMTGAKQRNLWLVAGALVLAAVAWPFFQARFDAARVFQWLLIALPILTVSAVAMLLKERGSVAVEADPAIDSGNWRKRMIAAGRGLAVRYTNSPRERNWRHYLERSDIFPQLRGHLSVEYMGKLTNSRAIYAMADGAKLEPLVEWFLDEMDRLEQEWGLR